MDTEIERKFFVVSLPDLSGTTPLHYERYFLKRGAGTEERISKVGDQYFHEVKTEVSNLERSRTKKQISADEFEALKQNASRVIVRDRYDISEHPKVSIQIYKSEYEGLVRAEVEFDSEEEAQAYQPASWMGDEMTDLPIARDSKLLDLTTEEFKSFLSR